MKQLDTALRALQEDQPALICPVRNEMALLPDFLAHHRALGVTQFIFIDNNSNDGTTPYLIAQSDCLVFWTDESYRASHYARDWINALITLIPIRGWLLYLDVDEHLVFAGMEQTPLIGLCNRLEAEGADTAFAAMIDMYPDGDFLNFRLDPARPLVVQMPWFDTDYVLRRWPQRPWDRSHGGFQLQVLGGPRCRLLSSLTRERRRGGLFYTVSNQVDRFIDAVPHRLLPALARLWPKEMAAQQKTPLNFVRPGFRYGNSHSTNNRRPSSELLALLHFKFCQELQQRFNMVAIEANHYRRGLHYLQMQQAIRRWPGKTLRYEGSCRYSSSANLLEARLLGPGPSVVWSGKAADFVTGYGDRSHVRTPAEVHVL